MGVLRGLGYLIAFLTVLAIGFGLLLFVLTIAWLARFILLAIAIVGLILCAVKEAFTKKPRRSSE